MKLADLVLANYKLLYVLPRFGIQIGVGEKTVKQVCEEKKISVSLFLLVCNVYTFDNYSIEKCVLNGISLSALINYLRNSHKEYLETRVPKVIANILDITKSAYSAQFEAFCQKYKTDIDAHFDYEEKVLFPYISSLLQGKKVLEYNIKEFQANHTNIEESLDDLKNILIKYLPQVTDFEQKRNALVELFMLEEDLNKHTLIEDKILVSSVAFIEESL